jgi:hypothetical protein
MTLSGSTTRTVADRLARSIEPPERGAIVLIRLDTDLQRPLVISSRTAMADRSWRVSGQIIVEAGDHTLPAFKDPPMLGRIVGHRLGSQMFLATAALVAEGDGVGQWMRRGKGPDHE